MGRIATLSGRVTESRNLGRKDAEPRSFVAHASVSGGLVLLSLLVAVLIGELAIRMLVDLPSQASRHKQRVEESGLSDLRSIRDLTRPNTPRSRQPELSES